MSQKKTLIIDLDDTLLKTDTLFELVLARFKKNPLFLFIVFFKLLSGRSQLKDYLSRHAVINVSHLPRNKKVFDLAHDYKKDGYEIILITGSNQIIADKVKDAFAFIDKCYGSTKYVNLVGAAKARFIDQELKLEEFSYVGDSSKDIHIWDMANEVIFAGSSKVRLKRKIDKRYANVIFLDENIGFEPAFRLLRTHQWVKNFLIFIPSVLAGTIFLDLNLVNLGLGFIAFSLIASATYILNDLIDLESDRTHVSKRFRPLAEGSVSIKNSIFMLTILSVTGVLISISLPQNFVIFLGLYVAITIAYSFLFKKMVLLDCIILSILYLMRLCIGASLTGDILTFWLMNFSFFFFLSLAFLKRFIEIAAIPETGLKISGRAYQKNDKNFIMGLGQSSGLVSMLVFSLYLYDKNIIQLQTDLFLTWAMIPLLVYWMTRIWFLANRDMVHDDPVVFAIKDRLSSLILFSCFLLFLFSGYF